MSKNLNDLKNIYLEQNIPHDINENIQSTLNNLPKPKNSNKNNMKKIASIITILTSSMLLIAALNSETVMSSIKSLFSNFKYSEVINENSDKYSETLDYTLQSNGKKIVIKDVIFSPKGISFTYVLDKSYLGDKINGTEEDSSPIIEKLLSTLFSEGMSISKLAIDDKEITPESVIGGCILSENSKELVGYQHITVDSLKEGQKISLVFNKVGVVSGEWNLELNSSIKINRDDVFVMKDSEKIDTNNGTIVIDEFISTPLYNHIIYTVDKGLGILIVNENNRNMAGNNNMTVKEIGDNKLMISGYLKNTPKGIKLIKVIPYLLPTSKSNNLNVHWNFLSKDITLPYTIDFGSQQSIIINSITETSEKVFVNVDVNAIDTDLTINRLGIALKSSEEIVNNPEIISNFNPIWYDVETYNELNNTNKVNNITLGFDKFNGEEEHVLVYSNNYLELLTDYTREIRIN